MIAIDSGTSQQPIPSSTNDHTESASRPHTAGWLAGICAVVGFVSIDPNASVGAGMGYFGLAGMVTFVCYFILRSK